MRLSHKMLAFGFCIVLSGSMLASQDTQTPKSNAKPLTNGDVVEMLKAGLSQEIVIAKINASACEFDTSPAALKVLKTANVPEAVILAMVQAPIGMPMQSRTSVGSNLPRVQETTNLEVSAPARVDCAPSHADPVPVFSAPRTQQALNQSLTDSVEVFKVKCGDRITILGDDKQSWLKMRTANGQVGYISSALVFIRPSAEKKRDEIQRAADDLEDCRVRAQNEYDTKMNLVGTLTLTPIQRVYASTRLKQNLDAELKSCRTQYESRLKALEAE
jgi:hypothetical protein